MIKIPAEYCPKNAYDLQSKFLVDKEMKLLPLSILKALNRQPRNLFTYKAAEREDGLTTIALDFDVQSDYMVRQFN